MARRKKAGFPKMVKDYDLTKERNGMAKTHDMPQLSNSSSQAQSPDEMMRILGFEPTQYMNPLQFLLAVMNNDTHAVYSDPTKLRNANCKGGFSIKYRIECAKIAARFMHMAMPKLNINSNADSKFSHDLQRAIADSNHRLLNREKIIEHVHATKPKGSELEPAAYPDVFKPESIRSASPYRQTVADGVEIEVVAGDAGEVGYNPDDDE